MKNEQKFYFAKITLQQLAQAEDEANKQANYEATVFHLHGAFLAFLQELSRFYKLSPLLGTTEAIRIALAAKGQVSPEISQLQAVEAKGWLGELQQAFTDCQLAPEPVEVQPEAELSEGLIIRAVTNPMVVDIEHRLQTWYTQLQRLLTEFRQEMVEF